MPAVLRSHFLEYQKQNGKQKHKNNRTTRSEPTRGSPHLGIERSYSYTVPPRICIF